VIVGPEGDLIGTNTPPVRAEQLIAGARRLLDGADTVRPGPVSQLEAATTAGSVFVVRDGDSMIAATTSAEPTVGLVFYDLKSCLRSLVEAPPRDATA
jgi:hypothetical protein